MPRRPVVKSLSMSDQSERCLRHRTPPRPLGKGLMQAKTYYQDDLVVVLMRGGYHEGGA